MISLMNMGLLDKNDQHQFAQTYSLAKGIKELGVKGEQAAMKEMQQLHECKVFMPININELTPLGRKRALESLIFLTEKKDGQVKGRKGANGSTQRTYVNREDAASPTAITESIILTSVIEAKEGRDVMVADVSNAFAQTSIEDNNKGERVIMKIRGPLVVMLLNLDEEKYEPFVLHEGKSKILFVVMQKALYGMLQSALLYYKKFKKDIEQIGFKINPYDPCVANRMVNGSQHTITWHVDDIKSSHVDEKVNNDFLHWLQAMYASDGIGQIKASRGLKHNYLGMTLDFSKRGELNLNMTDYIAKMVEEFPMELKGTTTCAWTDGLFKTEINAKKLDKHQAASKVDKTFYLELLF